MPRTSALSPKQAAPALLPVLLASLLLAGCGGSSSSTSTTANAAASASATGPAGPRTGRFAQLRECLQKNGITLPKPTPGTRRAPGSGGFFGGGAGRPLPAGVTRAQYEAALRKCGGARGGGSGRFLNSPARVQALMKFAACMRQNGVNVPAPNTSGNGPIFDTKGLNTTSTQFRTAETKCRRELQGALPRGPATTG
jgi:hypothetical protein